LVDDIPRERSQPTEVISVAEMSGNPITREKRSEFSTTRATWHELFAACQ